MHDNVAIQDEEFHTSLIVVVDGKAEKWSPAVILISVSDFDMLTFVD